MPGNAACIIADITDISLAANVHGQHYAIWLDRLFERQSLCVSPICCLMKYIEAAACLFAQANEIEHGEERKAPRIRNASSLYHGDRKAKRAWIGNLYPVRMADKNDTRSAIVIGMYQRIDKAFANRLVLWRIAQAMHI
jgi:hypothetical protein